ncbi:hypothetical protein [Sinorhizobium meliloti]|nr:hypothetical protein U8C39_09805 [Sinorhizobium meliloti]WQP18248.1 hypothetical protein U8C33_09925 [Sinorhizobium meliloti]WQP31744.1 hypothetical protein U8C45_09770 [Sinorhizobium meliloti]
MNAHRPVSSGATFRDRLPLDADLCQLTRMFVVVALRRFLCLLVLLAVVIGPVSVGAATSAMASSDMQMAAMASTDVSEDMSCCPRQPPLKNDCGSACPLGLVCAGSILAHADRAEGWSVYREARDASHALLQDSELSSAAIDPPARPPKA